MVKLYGKNGACSMAVHVLLNELGEKYEYVNAYDAHGKASDELKALNPLGQIPVLVDGDLTLTEGAAIINYLLDKHESPMLPKSGSGRAKALQWLAFANATMHPAYGRAFFLKGALGEGAEKEKALKIAAEKINVLWALVDARLAKQKYVAGEQFSAADILLTVIANWTSNVPGTITFGEHVKRLLKEVSARPAYQKTLTAEHVEYKAAA